jgi:hypothetical protein
LAEAVPIANGQQATIVAAAPIFSSAWIFFTIVFPIS